MYLSTKPEHPAYQSTEGLPLKPRAYNQSVIVSCPGCGAKLKANLPQVSLMNCPECGEWFTPKYPESPFKNSAKT